MILFTVCCIYTLNYVLLYLIAPFNVSGKWNEFQEEHVFVPYGDQAIEFGVVSWLAQGIYNDFNERWFQDIGMLIMQSYIILVILPPVEFLAMWFLRLLGKAWDQRKCCCCTKSMPMQTRKKTISAYKELY